MSSLPKSVTDRLSSRARDVLLGSRAKDEEVSTDKKVFGALENLFNQGQLRLTPIQVLDISIVYPTIARNLITPDAISTESLIKILPALTAVFVPKKNYTREDIRALRMHATCLESFLSITPPKVTRTLRNNGKEEEEKFIKQLTECYASLGLAAKILGGGKWDLADKDPESWKIDLVQAKLKILGILNILVTTYSSSNDNDELIAVAYHIVENSTGAEEGVESTPFVDRSLIGDYENAFHLTRTLLGLNSGTVDDPRIDHITQMVRSSAGIGNASPGGLQFLLDSPPSQPSSLAKTPFTLESGNTASASSKKGKARALTPEPGNDPILESQINEVQAILPDISRETIKRHLLDARYRGDVSRVIDILLDGGLPEEEEQPAAPTTQKYEFTASRANVFDEQEIDITKLRVGKQAVTRSVVDEAMKAEILRRVAELSSDEDEDEKDAQDVNWNDLDLSSADKATVSVSGDGEASEEDDASTEHGDNDEKQPPPPDTETILELAYLKDPEQFGRTAEIRRTVQRVELRKITGWSDEQIEGWKIMLEKNPKKDKILQKHEFHHNDPLSSATIQSSSSQEHHRGGRGRGHPGRGDFRGRGRGRGGEGRGGAENQGGADRNWKEKHKSRAGNHNRKRGHDKKMARGGGLVG